MAYTKCFLLEDGVDMSTPEETMASLPISSAPMENGIPPSDQDILHVSDVYHQMLDCLEDPTLTKHIKKEDLSHLEKFFGDLKDKPENSLPLDVSFPIPTAPIYPSMSPIPTMSTIPTTLPMYINNPSFSMMSSGGGMMMQPNSGMMIPPIGGMPMSAYGAMPPQTSSGQYGTLGSVFHSLASPYPNMIGAYGSTHMPSMSGMLPATAHHMPHVP